MTLRRRWTLSIAAILALFALNLSVYLWGNDRRSASLLALKTELERKDLIVEIHTAVDDRQRDTEVMEPLLASGAVELGLPEREEIHSRVGAIERRIHRLADLPGSRQIAELERGFEELKAAWAEVYESRPELGPASSEGLASGPRRSRFREPYEDLRAHLDRLETNAAEAAAEAEARFTRVATLTDRITLSIFVASSLLTIGIAVWFSRFLRGTFARYVTAEVVQNLLGTPAGLEIGGEKRLITVLMADLRGFTPMTEQEPAEKVVAALNNYLGTMTEIIVDAGGVIDEFIGDAILVFFGAPVTREDHAEAAVDCALRMQLAMREVNETNADQELPQLEMGIGIHSGEAVVGNIGSTTRTKYGAVGTPVNLASRIQSHSFGGQILVSAETLELVSAELRIDARFEIQPKGFEKAVEVVLVGGMDGETDLQLPRPGE